VAISSDNKVEFRAHSGPKKDTTVLEDVEHTHPDYTRWQREHFDRKTPEQINQEAETYVTEHPYKGNPSSII